MDPIHPTATQQSALPPQQFSIKRVFILLVIISLSASALIAILIFLLGSFGSIQLKVLITTLLVGIFSLTGLCSSTLFDKKRYLSLAYSGLISSILSFLLSVSVIWETIKLQNDTSKMLAILIILTLSFAHASLLFLITPTTKFVQIVHAATIVFIAIVALMLILLLLFEFKSEFYFRLLGVFAVLDVLGTIITPIIRKVKL